ncbi:uncharacterized protein PV07_01219 [Cladophialophora immunda]|uniref:Uncharacterized protein n=1 Tax=Cladophialophora immunda TaxID=569365 RepID=A0A0D2A285_9EURO|nr:uncharacterized protein PV07_01219 [Cladophialophora immunda]KIW34441.1 hypothetical protein PV07_01219 [Cladophialophora immunda]OQV06962.1 hypothetical protein CLAIMM_11458 [Cladophialophora immunda]
MSGTSSVGNSNVYEAGDQRVPPDSQKGGDQAYEEGQKNSHLGNDSKDSRSIANRLAASGPQNTTSNAADTSSSGKSKSAEARAGEVDPTAPARMHGNAPSRGAQVDKELQDEEAAILAKKDAAKGGSKSGGTGDVAGKKM